MSSKRKRTAIAFLLLLGACAVQGPKGKREHVEIRGVQLVMTEVAPDGEYSVYSQDRHRKVDANSTLRLEFDVPPAAEEVEASAEWAALGALLDRIDAAAAKYLELAKRGRKLTRADAPFDENFVNDAQAAQNEAVDILFSIAAPTEGVALLTSGEISDVMAANPTDPYGNLATVVNSARAALHDRAARFADDKDLYEVLVRAYLVPVGGTPQALHVPGYDNLPQGDFRPLDPTALLPTPEESARLNAELAAAGEVKSSIREIRSKGKQIGDVIEGLADDVRAKLEQLESKLRSDLLSLSPREDEDVLSAAFLARVGSVETAGGESAAFVQAVSRLVEGLDRVQELVEKMGALRQQATRLAKPGGVASLDDIQSLVDGITTGITDIGTLTTEVGGWGDLIETALAAVPKILEAELEQSLEDGVKTLRDDALTSFKSALEDLEKRLPATAGALQTLAALHQQMKLAKGLTDIGAEDPQRIPRPLDDLVPAELDLRYSGITVGDNVQMSVEMRPKNQDTEESSEPKAAKPDVVYNLEATQAGWHRRFSGDVIFSKTDSGPASDDFKSNVGLSMEWHHYDREDPWSFWNRLDPGAGFHAAFLDQDTGENIELGGGINASVLNGLVRVGYGYNISSDDNNEYWFVGFGLFGLLGNIQKLGGASSGDS